MLERVEGPDPRRDMPGGRARPRLDVSGARSSWTGREMMVRPQSIVCRPIRLLDTAATEITAEVVTTVVQVVARSRPRLWPRPPMSWPRPWPRPSPTPDRWSADKRRRKTASPCLRDFDISSRLNEKKRKKRTDHSARKRFAEQPHASGPQSGLDTRASATRAGSPRRNLR